jgi:hypothetical protein
VSESQEQNGGNYVEGAYNLYSSETATVIDLRSVRLAARVDIKVVIINMYRILSVVPKGMSPHGRPSCKLEVNSEMDLEDMDFATMAWIQQIQAMPSCGLLCTS